MGAVASILSMNKAQLELGAKLKTLTSLLGLTSTQMTQIHDFYKRMDALNHGYITISQYNLRFGISPSWVGYLIFNSVRHCLDALPESHQNVIQFILATWNFCTSSNTQLAHYLFRYFHVTGSTKGNMFGERLLVFVGPDRLSRLEVDRLVEIEFGSASVLGHQIQDLLHSLPQNEFGDIRREDFVNVCLKTDNALLKPLIEMQVKVRLVLFNKSTWILLSKHRENTFGKQAEIWDIAPPFFESPPQPAPAGSEANSSEKYLATNANTSSETSAGINLAQNPNTTIRGSTQPKSISHNHHHHHHHRHSHSNGKSPNVEQPGAVNSDASGVDDINQNSESAIKIDAPSRPKSVPNSRSQSPAPHGSPQSIEKTEVARSMLEVVGTAENVGLPASTASVENKSLGPVQAFFVAHHHHHGGDEEERDRGHHHHEEHGHKHAHHHYHRHHHGHHHTEKIPDGIIF